MSSLKEAELLFGPFGKDLSQESGWITVQGKLVSAAMTEEYHGRMCVSSPTVSFSTSASS